MAKIVEITQSQDSVTLNKEGQATIPFTVKNIRSSQLRVGAKVIAEPAQQAWYKLEKPEKQLGYNATDQFTVQVDTKNAPEGKYKLKLLVYSVENPGDDCDESETIAVIVPAQNTIVAPTPPPSKWWIWVVVGVLVTSLLGSLAYYLITKKADDPQAQTLAFIPDVKGKLLENATEELGKLEFKDIKTETKFDATAAKNTVLLQKPDAGIKSDPAKTQIVLVLADSTTTMPNLKDLSLQGATERLKNLGLTKISHVQKFDPNNIGIVVEQSPPPDTSVTNEQDVALTIGYAGEVVPPLVNKSLTDALAALGSVKLELVLPPKTQYNAGLAEGTVITQDPASGGQNVAPGTKITLVVSTQKGLAPNWGIYLPLIRQHKVLVNSEQFRKLEPAKPIAPTK